MTPSRQDIEVTERLVRAGRILGIPVLDQIVWTRDCGHHAIRESHPHVFSGE